MVGNVLKLVKIGGGIIASAGATTVVEHAIKATTPAVTSTATKMLVKVGAMAVGGVMAKHVIDLVDHDIEYMAELIGIKDDPMEEVNKIMDDIKEKYPEEWEQVMEKRNRGE